MIRATRPKRRRLHPNRGLAIRASRSSSRKSKLRIPEEMTLSGSVDFRATPGKPNNPGRIFLLANTGKPMRVDGFSLPVVVDMKGHSFAKDTTPIIGDHKTNNRFGHTLDQITVPNGKTQVLAGRTVKGPAIAAVGTRSSQSDYAEGVEADLKAKFPFQVSVGTRILDGYVVEEGQTDRINGHTVEGPVIVASKTMTRELTLTVLGADGDTQVSIAARAKLGDDSMSWKEWLKSLGVVESKLNAKQKKAYKAQYDLYIAAQEPDDNDEDEVDDEPVRSRRGGGTATLPKPKRTIGGRRIQASDPDDDDEEEDEEDEGGGNERHGRNRVRGRLRASAQDLDITAQLADETERVDGINRLYTEFSEQLSDAEFKVGKKKLTFGSFKAHAIRNHMDVTEFELQCRRASYHEPDNSPETIRAAAAHIKSGSYDSRAVELGILRACGVVQSGEVRNMHTKESTGRKYGWEHMFPEEVLEAADAKKYRFTGSIDELLDVCIRANGHYPIARHGSDLMAQAHKVWHKLTDGGQRLPNDEIQASGFSTLYLTNILENVGNKAAIASFDSVEGTWTQWVGVRNAQDFKPLAMYTLDLDGSFKKVAPDGELKHITMRDTKRTLQIETYGCMITIDRKTRINDDLGLVVQKASSLGLLAAIRQEESVYVLLLSNAGSFFSAGNGNLLTGAGSVLGIDALTSAQLKYQMQTLYGRQIVVTPQILLTGLTLGQTAINLYNQSKYEQGMASTATAPLFTNNPHVGRFRPVISGWIDNTSLRDQDGNAITGQTAVQSYLLGAANTAQGSVMEIAFLNGRRVPFFDSADTQFNVPGGVQMRSYGDWGVGFGVSQLGVKLVGS